MALEPGPDQRAVSYRTKQLLVLATDLLLDAVAFDEPGAAERLVAGHVLPACYRDRYDEGFVEEFAAVVKLARNLLVSDNPFVPDTLSELAGHAIFSHARLVLEARGEGVQESAAAIDPTLPGALQTDHSQLNGELDLLYDDVFEDTDVLTLFDLPDAADPDSLARLRLRPGERDLLRFENWQRRFGRVPRPHITDDARAWRVAL